MIDRLPDITFKTPIYVIPKDLNKILPGEPFLIDEEVSIDYRYTSVRIAGRVLVLDENTRDFMDSPDGELQERSCYSQKANLKKEKSLVEAFSRNNPILGTIPNQDGN